MAGDHRGPPAPTRNRTSTSWMRFPAPTASTTSLNRGLGHRRHAVVGGLVKSCQAGAGGTGQPAASPAFSSTAGSVQSGSAWGADDGWSKLVFGEVRSH